MEVQRIIEIILIIQRAANVKALIIRDNLYEVEITALALLSQAVGTFFTESARECFLNHRIMVRFHHLTNKRLYRDVAQFAGKHSLWDYDNVDQRHK